VVQGDLQAIAGSRPRIRFPPISKKQPWSSILDSEEPLKLLHRGRAWNCCICIGDAWKNWGLPADYPWNPSVLTRRLDDKAVGSSRDCSGVFTTL